MAVDSFDGNLDGTGYTSNVELSDENKPLVCDICFEVFKKRDCLMAHEYWNTVCDTDHTSNIQLSDVATNSIMTVDSFERNPANTEHTSKI